MSPSHQPVTIPLVAIPIHTSATFQGDYSSNFQMIVLSRLSLLLKMNLSFGKRLNKLESDVTDIK